MFHKNTGFKIEEFMHVLDIELNFLNNNTLPPFLPSATPPPQKNVPLLMDGSRIIHVVQEMLHTYYLYGTLPKIRKGYLLTVPLSIYGLITHVEVEMYSETLIFQLFMTKVKKIKTYCRLLSLVLESVQLVLLTL